MSGAVKKEPIPGAEHQKRGSASRAAREAALEQAALALLRENGALAGLNLREVADRAGINRGLVYHYYGSREELLRTTLKRNLAPRLAEISAGSSLPFPNRVRQLLRTLVGHEEAIRLVTLLLLDRGGPLSLMPLFADWLENLERDQRDKKVKEDIDGPAMVALITCLGYGFVLFRKQLAREMGMSVADFDWRIDEALRRLLDALEPDPVPDPTATNRSKCGPKASPKGDRRRRKS